MVYAESRICPEEWDAQTPGFWHKNGSTNLGQTARPYNNQQKKKRTCRTVDFAGPADHSVKFKGGEKKDKYLDLASELKINVEHEVCWLYQL